MYTIKNGPNAHFAFHGGAKEFVSCKGPEAMIHGPAETGKSISLLTKLHLCACKYPNSSLVMMRKTQASTYSTIVPMFRNKVLDDGAPVTAYGGEKPGHFQYENGSRIWVAGMDKSSKVLSSEHDIIAIFQADEIDIDDWEICTTRTTGRAGNMPYAQTLGDMNPTYPLHWPYHRESLKVFHSKHKDNPTLYDPVTNELTTQGKKTMEVLGRLTGVRRDRLLVGIPSQAEGAIYNYNESRHLINSDDVPTCFRYIAGIDWGYRNAGVLGIFGIDGRNGAMYLVAQHYHTMKTDDWWLKHAKGLDDYYSREIIIKGGKAKERLIEAWICDPSEPAYIDKFKRAGLNAIGGYNAVLPGITAVQERLDNDLLFVTRDSLLIADEKLKSEKQPYRVQDEFSSYVWADNRVKEQPVKQNDHGMDMMRYTVCYLDNVGRDEIREAGVW